MIVNLGTEITSTISGNQVKQKVAKWSETRSDISLCKSSINWITSIIEGCSNFLGFSHFNAVFSSPVENKYIYKETSKFNVNIIAFGPPWEKFVWSYGSVLLAITLRSPFFLFLMVLPWSFPVSVPYWLFDIFFYSCCKNWRKGCNILRLNRFLLLSPHIWFIASDWSYKIFIPF